MRIMARLLALVLVLSLPLLAAAQSASPAQEALTPEQINTMRKTVTSFLDTVKDQAEAVLGIEEKHANRVFDRAGLFTTEQADTLQAAIKDIRTNAGCDFAILVENMETADYQRACDELFEAETLGLGLNRTAFICYLALHADGTYQCYSAVYGDLVNLMVEEDVQYLADNAVQHFDQGDFTGGFVWTINMLSEALVNMGVMSVKRVYDFADDFSKEQTIELEREIADFRALSGSDFLYLSTWDEIPNNDGDYMGTFYEHYGFGDGESRSGAMIHFDWGGEYYYVELFGDIGQLIPQEELNAILEASDEVLYEGMFYEAILELIDQLAAYYR